MPRCGQFVKHSLKLCFFIVNKCILNQTHDYWLIFNTLHAAFPISVSMQMEIQQFQTTSNNFIRGNFEFELQALHLHMMTKILDPFLSFATTCTPSKAHNMLVLMLDSHFKCLDVVKAFVRGAKVMEIVAKYDIKSLMLLLVPFTSKMQVLLSLRMHWWLLMKIPFLA